MATYDINKGIGRSVEFYGLTGRYLFVLAGGMLAVILAVMIIYMAGGDSWTCLAFGIITASALSIAVFRMNEKYGEHGLTKISARRNMPRRIRSSKGINRIIREK